MFKCQKSKIFEHVRKLRFQTKAQAAMEFLMTYGWAILVVLVAIGALAYFGVLNPGKYLPASCVITPGISCEDFAVRADGTASIILRNGMGQDLTDVTLTIPTCTAVEAGRAMNDGTTLTFTYTGCTVTGGAGSQFKQDITFSYTGSGGLGHNKTGVLALSVE